MNPDNEDIERTFINSLTNVLWEKYSLSIHQLMGLVTLPKFLRNSFNSPSYENFELFLKTNSNIFSIDRFNNVTLVSAPDSEWSNSHQISSSQNYFVSSRNDQNQENSFGYATYRANDNILSYSDNVKSSSSYGLHYNEPFNDKRNNATWTAVRRNGEQVDLSNPGIGKRAVSPIRSTGGESWQPEKVNQFIAGLLLSAGKDVFDRKLDPGANTQTSGNITSFQKDARAIENSSWESVEDSKSGPKWEDYYAKKLEADNLKQQLLWFLQRDASNQMGLVTGDGAMTGLNITQDIAKTQKTMFPFASVASTQWASGKSFPGLGTAQSDVLYHSDLALNPVTNQQMLLNYGITQASVSPCVQQELLIPKRDVNSERSLLQQTVIMKDAPKRDVHYENNKQGLRSQGEKSRSSLDWEKDKDYRPMTQNRSGKRDIPKQEIPRYRSRSRSPSGRPKESAGKRIALQQDKARYHFGSPRNEKMGNRSRSRSLSRNEKVRYRSRSRSLARNVKVRYRSRSPSPLPRNVKSRYHSRSRSPKRTKARYRSRTRSPRDRLDLSRRHNETHNDKNLRSLEESRKTSRMQHNNSETKREVVPPQHQWSGENPLTDPFVKKVHSVSSWIPPVLPTQQAPVYDMALNKAQVHSVFEEKRVVSTEACYSVGTGISSQSETMANYNQGIGHVPIQHQPILPNFQAYNWPNHQAMPGQLISGTMPQTQQHNIPPQNPMVYPVAPEGESLPVLITRFPYAQHGEQQQFTRNYACPENQQFTKIPPAINPARSNIDLYESRVPNVEHRRRSFSNDSRSLDSWSSSDKSVSPHRGCQRERYKSPTRSSRSRHLHSRDRSSSRRHSRHRTRSISPSLRRSNLLVLTGSDSRIGSSRDDRTPGDKSNSKKNISDFEKTACHYYWRLASRPGVSLNVTNIEKCLKVTSGKLYDYMKKMYGQDIRKFFESHPKYFVISRYGIVHSVRGRTEHPPSKLLKSKIVSNSERVSKDEKSIESTNAEDHSTDLKDEKSKNSDSSLEAEQSNASQISSKEEEKNANSESILKEESARIVSSSESMSKDPSTKDAEEKINKNIAKKITVVKGKQASVWVNKKPVPCTGKCKSKLKTSGKQLGAAKKSKPLVKGIKTDSPKISFNKKEDSGENLDVEKTIKKNNENEEIRINDDEKSDRGTNSAADTNASLEGTGVKSDTTNKKASNEKKDIKKMERTVTVKTRKVGSVKHVVAKNIKPPTSTLGKKLPQKKPNPLPKKLKGSETQNSSSKSRSHAVISASRPLKKMKPVPETTGSSTKVVTQASDLKSNKNSRNNPTNKTIFPKQGSSASKLGKPGGLTALKLEDYLEDISEGDDCMEDEKQVDMEDISEGEDYLENENQDGMEDISEGEDCFDDTDKEQNSVLKQTVTPAIKVTETAVEECSVSKSEDLEQDGDIPETEKGPISVAIDSTKRNAEDTEKVIVKETKVNVSGSVTESDPVPIANVIKEVPAQEQDTVKDDTFVLEQESASAEVATVREPELVAKDIPTDENHVAVTDRISFNKEYNIHTVNYEKKGGEQDIVIKNEELDDEKENNEEDIDFKDKAKEIVECGNEEMQIVDDEIEDSEDFAVTDDELDAEAGETIDEYDATLDELDDEDAEGINEECDSLFDELHEEGAGENNDEYDATLDEVEIEDAEEINDEDDSTYDELHDEGAEDNDQYDEILDEDVEENYECTEDEINECDGSLDDDMGSVGNSEVDVVVKEEELDDEEENDDFDATFELDEEDEENRNEYTECHVRLDKLLGYGGNIESDVFVVKEELEDSVSELNVGVDGQLNSLDINEDSVIAAVVEEEKQNVVNELGSEDSTGDNLQNSVVKEEKLNSRGDQQADLVVKQEEMDDNNVEDGKREGFVKEERADLDAEGQESVAVENTAGCTVKEGVTKEKTEEHEQDARVETPEKGDISNAAAIKDEDCKPPADVKENPSHEQDSTKDGLDESVGQEEEAIEDQDGVGDSAAQRETTSGSGGVRTRSAARGRKVNAFAANTRSPRNQKQKRGNKTRK